MIKKIKVQVALAKSKLGTSWAVIRDPANGKYLLCRRAEGTNNAGQWGFPGGGVDEGESQLAALVREMFEEIVVRVDESMLHAVAQTGTVMWFEMFLRVKPKKTEEVDAFQWVNAYDLDQYELHKSVKDYFKALRNQAR